MADPASMRMHADELAVPDDLVRTLVARQLPHLASRALTRLPASGSSNVLFRLGDDLLIRFPRQPGGSATIRQGGEVPATASRGVAGAAAQHRRGR